MGKHVFFIFNPFGEILAKMLFCFDSRYSLESIGKWLWPLPESMQEKSKIIFLGGITDIVPCEWVSYLLLFFLTTKDAMGIYKEKFATEIIASDRKLTKIKKIENLSMLNCEKRYSLVSDMMTLF